MPHALGRGLHMIVDGSGSAAASVHSANRIGENLAIWGRNLWLHPAANARSNSIHALYVAFLGRVRHIGYSNLSQFDRGLTLDHMLCIGLR